MKGKNKMKKGKKDEKGKNKMTKERKIR